MLGKLTKNTFKSNASAVANVYIAMGIIGVIMLILLVVDWTKLGETGLGIGLIIKIVAASALVITSGIAVIMTFVAVFSDYSKNMFGDEGHLTMSLPVRSSTLLFSKWISGTFWVLLSYLMLCLALFGSFIYIAKHSMSIVQGNEVYYSVYDLVLQLIEQICISSGIATPSMGILLNLAGMYAVSGGIRACVFVLLGFFAFTLSHCKPFHKLGRIGWLLYGIGAVFAVSAFSGIITKLVKIYIVISEESFTFTLSELEVASAWDKGLGAFSITNIYCTAIAAVFIFLVTILLIDRKVNVD